MRRTVVRMGLACLLLLPLAGCGSRESETLENHFSSEYILLVSVNDAAALKEAFEKTAFWATWTEPEVRQSLEAMLRDFEREFEQGLGMSSKAFFDALPGKAVAGLAPPKPGDRRGGPRLALIVELDQAKTNADRILAHLRQEVGERRISKGTFADGTAYERFDRGLVVAIKGNLFGLADNPQTLEEVMKGPLPREARLCNSDRYKAAMKPLGPRPAASMVIYFDLAGLFARLETDGDLRRERVAYATMDRLGLFEIQAIAAAQRMEGTQIAGRVHLYAPGWTKGILRPFGREARALLKTVPPEAVGAAAVSLDLGQLYDLIAGAFEGFGRTVEEANREVGIDLRRDLFEALDGQAALYFLPAEDPAPSILPRVVIEAGVRNREALARALDRIAARVARDFSNGPATYSREEVEGGTVLHLVWSATPPVQVAVAAGEKRLVMATRKADALAALRRAGEPLRQSFLDNRSVTKALDRVGSDGALVAYFDLKTVAAKTYESLAPLALSRERMGEGGRPAPRTRSFPPAEALFKHLPPMASCVTVTRDGLVWSSEGLTGGVTPAMSAMLLPALFRARTMARRVVCSSNLRQVGLALFQFAMANNDQLPTSLEDLKEHLGGQLDPVARCPVSGQRHVLVLPPGKRLGQLRPDTILAYDAVAAHDGGRNVLFADGHVEWMDEARFQKALAGSQTRPAPGTD